MDIEQAIETYLFNATPEAKDFLVNYYKIITPRVKRLDDLISKGSKSWVVQSPKHFSVNLVDNKAIPFAIYENAFVIQIDSDGSFIIHELNDDKEYIGDDFQIDPEHIRSQIENAPSPNMTAKRVIESVLWHSIERAKKPVPSFGSSNLISQLIHNDISPEEKRTLLEGASKKRVYTTIPEIFSQADISMLFGDHFSSIFRAGSDNESIRKFQNFIKNSIKDGAKSVTSEFEESLRQKLFKIEYSLPITLGSFKKDVFELMSADLLNFILSTTGKNPEEAAQKSANRALFIASMCTMAGYSWDDLIQTRQASVTINHPDYLKKRRLDDLEKNINTILEHSKRHPDGEVIFSTIDQGKFPRQEIAALFGIKNISAKQFRTALQKQIQNPSNKLENSFALSKIPSEWLTYTLYGQSKHMLLDSAPYSHNNPTIHEALLTIQKLYPFFVDLGKEISELDHLHQLASKNGDSEAKRDVNKRRKFISSQWSMLSKKDDALEAMLAMGSEYKINEELSDYSRILNGFINALVKRMAHDLCGESGFYLGGQNVDLEINHLRYTLAAVMEDKRLQDIEDLDDDHPDNFYSVLNQISKKDIDFNQLTATDYLRFPTVALSSLLKNNRDLHKNMSDISKNLAIYSKNDKAWTGLINENVDINDFTFEPIASRKRLLHEGVVLSHCVYGYLGDCMRGKTSIISILNNEGVPVATMEVRQEEGNDNHTHHIAQLYGFNNSEVPNEIRDAAEIFIDKINNPKVLRVNDLLKENKGDVECADLETLADAEFIPFLTDAIFDAYAILRDHIPSDISLIDTFSLKSNSMKDLINHTCMGQTMLAMETLCDVYGLSTAQITDVGKKYQHTLPRLTQALEKLPIASNSMSECRVMSTEITDYLSNQDSQRTISHLASEFGTVNDTDLDSWIKANSESIPKNLSVVTARQLIRNTITLSCPKQAGLALLKATQHDYKVMKNRTLEALDGIRQNLPEYLSADTLINTMPDNVLVILRELDAERENDRGLQKIA